MQITITQNQFLQLLVESDTFRRHTYDLLVGGNALEVKAQELAKIYSSNKIGGIKALREWSSNNPVLSSPVGMITATPTITAPFSDWRHPKP